MKKILLLLLTLLLIVVAGVWYYFFSPFNKVAIEQVLPKNPLVYIKFSDVKANLKELEANPVFKTIKELNYEAIFNQNNAAGQWAMLSEIIQQITDPQTTQYLDKFFGQDFAIATYKPDIDMTQPIAWDEELISKILSSLYIVTRVKPDVKIAEFVSRSFHEYGDVTMVSEKFEDYTLHLIEIPNAPVKLGMVRIKDLLIIGLESEGLKNSIKTFQKAKASVLDSKDFKQSFDKALHPQAMFVYFNTQDFYYLLHEKIISGMTKMGASASDTTQIQEALQNFEGFDALSFSAQLEKVHQIQVDMFYDTAKMQGSVAQFYQRCRSIDNATLSFVPQDVIGYQWGQCFFADFYFEQIKAEWQNNPSETESFEEALGKMESALGFSFEGDVLPALGDEIGGYIEDVTLLMGIPVPKLALFLKIKDQAKAEALIEGLTKNSMFLLQNEDYQNHAIRYVALPMGDFQPGYTFIDGYLLAAVSKEMLKRAIDVRKDSSQSIAANPAFKAVDFGLTDKNINVTYIEFKKVAEVLKQLVQWGKGWASSQNQNQEAFRTGSEKRLADIKVEIMNNQKELDDLTSELTKTQEAISQMEALAQDVSQQKIQQQDIQTRIDDLQRDMLSLEEQKSKVDAVLAQYDRKQIDPQKTQFYLDQVILPIIDSFAAIQSLGIRTTMDDRLIESTMYFSFGPE